MGSILLNKRPILRNSALCVLRMRVENNAHAKPKRAPKGPFISVEKLR